MFNLSYRNVILYRLLITITALLTSACVNTHQGTWQPMPNSRGDSFYYWSSPEVDPSNNSLITARILLNDHTQNESAVFNITYDCTNTTARMNHIKDYSERFAQGKIYTTLEDFPNRFDPLPLPLDENEPFAYVYLQVCPQ